VRRPWASTARAELKCFVINEIHLCTTDLANHPSQSPNSNKRTAMYFSIFGNAFHFKVADATHIKRIFVWPAMRTAEGAHI
jgi:hypothetical protein